MNSPLIQDLSGAAPQPESMVPPMNFHLSNINDLRTYFELNLLHEGMSSFKTTSQDHQSLFSISSSSSNSDAAAHMPSSVSWNKKYNFPKKVK